MKLDSLIEFDFLNDLMIDVGYRASPDKALRQIDGIPQIILKQRNRGVRETQEGSETSVFVRTSPKERHKRTIKVER